MNKKIQLLLIILLMVLFVGDGFCKDVTITMPKKEFTVFNVKVNLINYIKVGETRIMEVIVETSGESGLPPPKPELKVESSDILKATVEPSVLTGGGIVTITGKSVSSHKEDVTITIKYVNEKLAEAKVTIYDILLNELSYSGDKYKMVKNDDGIDCVAPHWKDNSNPIDGDADDKNVTGGTDDIKYPVCYLRNTKMKISAKFKIVPIDMFDIVLTATAKIAGNGPKQTNNQELDFPISAANILNAEKSIAIQNVECQNPFVNEINLFNPLEIYWSMSFDAGATWHSCGKSSNQVYGVWKEPQKTVYHTAIHMGCDVAKGMTEPKIDSDICDKIWEVFKTRSIKRVSDNEPLFYYNSFLTINTKTEQLIANRDGQCGSWAKFLIDTISNQGIDHLKDYAIFTAKADGFLVKEWNFIGVGTSGDPDYPYFNIPDSPYTESKSYKWKFAEVTYTKGTEGQGPNSYPASLFGNHQIVYFDSKYYDPSYGLDYASKEKLEDDAISGYFKVDWKSIDESIVGLDLNGDGDMTDSIYMRVFFIKRNPTDNYAQDLSEDYYEYP